MRTFEEIVNIIKEVCTPVADENTSPKSIKIEPRDLLKVMQELLGNKELFFDSLSCVTGVDNGAAAGTMEVIYNLYSIPYHHHLMVKVILPRDNAAIDTVCHIWRTADWQEREIFDMYGIIFNNHPDLRRILMPSDWDGFPLRKDYTQQEYYRDIKVSF